MVLHDPEVDTVLIETFTDGHIELRQGITDVIYLSKDQADVLKQYMNDMVGER